MRRQNQDTPRSEIVEFKLHLEEDPDSRYRIVHYTAAFRNAEGERIEVAGDTRIEFQHLQARKSAAWLLSEILADFIAGAEMLD